MIDFLDKRFIIEPGEKMSVHLPKLVNYDDLESFTIESGILGKHALSIGKFNLKEHDGLWLYIRRYDYDKKPTLSKKDALFGEDEKGKYRLDLIAKFQDGNASVDFLRSLEAIANSVTTETYDKLKDMSIDMQMLIDKLNYMSSTPSIWEKIKSIIRRRYK